MLKVVRALVILVAGCSFHSPQEVVDASGNGEAGGGDSARSIDAPPPLALHLAASDGIPGDTALMLSGTVSIDTGAPSIGVTLPGSDTFDLRPQLDGGPRLAVLHVGSLSVASLANVKITGPNPLVIVASSDVDIAGLLDASAHGTTRGPGGAMPGAGNGKGSNGAHGDNASDSGGGGGGYGMTGAKGGAIDNGCTVDAGNAGGTDGDAPITVLVGGSSGGESSGTACDPDLGGAGGGAIQISTWARIAISVTGRINAGGGGGSGGTDCGDSDVNSAAGGGSGGAIVLQAPSISNDGVIAANGGGGGGSSFSGNGSGTPGQDGQSNATPATGGTGASAPGGKGAAGAIAATSGGTASCGENAGGGGGGVGWIAVSAGYTGAGVASPSPDTSLPP
jgi:hypothetical protein